MSRRLLLLFLSLPLFMFFFLLFRDDKKYNEKKFTFLRVLNSLLDNLTYNCAFISFLCLYELFLGK